MFQRGGKAPSEETKRKIGEKASQRPGSLTNKKGPAHPRWTGGVARDLKQPSNADYVWKNEVRTRCNQTCVVSLEKNPNRGRGFVCHHLNSYDVHVAQRYLPENGVYLKREIHGQFHRLYGSGNNTESQFAEFCLKQYGFDWYKRKKELKL